jgi:DHA1 family tetracycline resistance protein-like MFS transporter
LLALWGFAGPSVQSLMTQRVSAIEQGRLQGANSSLTGVAQMIGPSLFTRAFAFFIGPARPLHLPGAPFLLAAALLIVAIGIALRAARTD